jgi:membrane protease YdiL (CAAX protease family)
MAQEVGRYQHEVSVKKSTGYLKRHSLITGIILMFLLTWPIDLANSGILPFHVPSVVALLVGWGFVFASLIMTGLTLGKAGVIALLKRFLIWRVGLQWYLVAFLLLPVIDSSAVLLNAAFSATPTDFSSVMAYKIFGPSANLPLLILPWFLYEVFTNGEEIGWRGYVLPRLQAKHTALVSSLILGLVWGLWHFPKFLATGNTSPSVQHRYDSCMASAHSASWSAGELGRSAASMSDTGSTSYDRITPFICHCSKGFIPIIVNHFLSVYRNAIIALTPFA